MSKLRAPLTMGETAPIDELRWKELMDLMKESGEYESHEAVEHRKALVGKLEDLMKEFTQRICTEKNIPSFCVEDYYGKLHTFGLHRLGVHLQGSHIDVLCVTPQIVERKDFFQTFFEILKEETSVKDLRAVEDAYVPVIKLIFDGIEIHIVFARLAFCKIPDSYDIRIDNLLRNLNEFCVRSMNWCRGTEEILRLVPNVDKFRDCLQAILYWARSRRICGNVWGYLSDLSWAILVAKICQLHPDSSPSTLFQRFFSKFSEWDWSNPIDIKKRVNNDLNILARDPTSVALDKPHYMPILCPAYPYLNSAFNVSRSSREATIKELRRGRLIISDIYDKNESWGKLFEERDFFTEYKHFIMMTASWKDGEDHKKWTGLVESRIRILVCKMERTDDTIGAHIYTKAFDKGKNMKTWFVGLDLGERIRIAAPAIPLQYFANMIYGQARKWGFYRDGMSVTAEYKNQEDVVKYLPLPVASATSVRAPKRSLEVTSDESSVASKSGRLQK